MFMRGVILHSFRAYPFPNNGTQLEEQVRLFVARSTKTLRILLCSTSSFTCPHGPRSLRWHQHEKDATTGLHLDQSERTSLVANELQNPPRPEDC